MSRRLRTGRDERGVSLILVLVTLVVFGLIVPVLGQFGATNGVSGYVLKGQRFDRYAAEAGMQAAINWAQGQRQAGRQGTTCPSITTGNLNGNADVNATRSVRVECAGFDGNGLPEETDTIPAYALMARSTDTQAIHVSGNGSVRTDGPWWSEGGIKVDGPTIDASADYIGAKRPCSGITGSPKDCPSARSEADPGYRPAIPAVIPVDQPGPDNPCDAVRNHELLLDSGLHWDATLLDDVGDGRCGDVTIRLLDNGPHIFDFRFFDDQTTSRPDWRLVPGRRNATVRVVSDGWSDGGCSTRSPVLFAGAFTMQVGAGAAVDVCGADESGQQIAVAQVAPGTPPLNEPETTPRTPSRWTVDRHNGSFDLPQSSPQTPAGLLSSIDCAPRRACNGGFVTGNLRGDRAEGDVVMTVPDPVPAGIGAKLDHLHLKISHQEQGDVATRRIWISAGLPVRFECDLSQAQHSLDAATDWETDDYNCVPADFNRPYFPTGDLTVTYQVQLDRQQNNEPTPSADLSIDAVQLTAVYAKSTARNSAPGGDILEVDPGGALHAAGTMYLPGGDVTLDFGNAAASTFARGVVVSTIDVKNLPTQPLFAPFSLPNGGNYTDRLATFQAFLGTDTTQTPLITARVRFCDAHPDGADVNVSAECSGIAGGPARILAWDPTR